MSIPMILRRMSRGKAKAAADARMMPRVSATLLDDGEAELIMYGDVMENEPIDWWTGEPTGELCVSSQAVLAALETIQGASHVTVRMNSGGGDAFAGVAIHNILKNLAAKVTIHIEGLSASAASIIACAGDEVVVDPGSLFMIHRGYMPMFGWYTPDELEKTSNEFNAIGQAMLNIYVDKTGRPEEEIRPLLDAETWFVGQEIVDAGFADSITSVDGEEEDEGDVDEVIYDEATQTLLVAGIRHDVSMCRAVPVASFKQRLHAPRATRGAQAIDMQAPPVAATTEGETHMDTVEELRASHPELADEVARQAAQAERDRIRAIDAISAQVAPDLVEAAKYGDNPCTAEQLALRQLQVHGAAASNFLAQAEEDDDESNADEVGSDANSGNDKGDEDDDKEAEACIAQAVAIVNAQRGRKDN